MTEETLFHQALALPAGTRSAFLDRACEGQPQLLEAVLALLRAHEGTGTLLPSPATVPPTAGESQASDMPSTTEAPTPPATADHRPPVADGVLIAGRYALEQKLGEGGMGEVWVARQAEPVKRRVALKLIKPGMDSRGVLQRFEQERQALAMMDHPSIARVLDAGLTPSGQPFFAMELVNGLPLNRFCDEARLTSRQRIELFVPICQAVQHAHQKGIVHRDLKPANVLVTLVDGRPVPKVIDFGVAKATAGKLTDESMNTQFGSVVGTLEYMAPEQAGFSSDDIDTRADIYSLGVILYELLTGLRPIDSKRLRQAAFTEMVRIIREEEPLRPSTRISTDDSAPSLAALRQTEPRKLSALLRGDLDWVVMKCLEKSRDRRYETANALARDIQRHLADEPVEARPPSAGYRLSRFVRRHRGRVIAGGLVLGALLAGLVGTSLALLEARRQTDLVRQESERKRAALEHAENRERLAVEAVGRFREVVASNPELKDDPTLGSLRRSLLKEPLEFYKKLRDELESAADPSSTSLERMAEATYALAKTHEEIGEQADVLPALREAEAVILRALRQAPSSPTVAKALADTRDSIGNTLQEMGRFEEAMEVLRSGIEVAQDLLEAAPESPENRMLLNKLRSRVALALFRAGKYPESRDLYRLCRESGTELLAADPSSKEARALASYCNDLGIVLNALGEGEGGLASLNEGLAHRKQLVASAPDDARNREQLSASYANLGTFHLDRGERSEALELLEAAAELDQALSSEHPSVVKYKVYVAQDHASLARLLEAGGQVESARDRMLRARDIYLELAGNRRDVVEFQRSLGKTLRELGDLEYRQFRYEDALDLYKSAERTLASIVSAHPDAFLALGDLAASKELVGLTLLMMGDPERAGSRIAECIDLGKKLLSQSPKDVLRYQNLASSFSIMGHVAMETRDFESARDHFRSYVDTMEQFFEKGGVRTESICSTMMGVLANARYAQTQLGDATGAAESQRRIEEWEATDPHARSLDPRLAAVLSGAPLADDGERVLLAVSAINSKRFALAARLWAEALEAHPELANDRQAEARVHAARAAARAAAGGSSHEAPVDEAARGVLRSRALGWLVAELEALSASLDASSPVERATRMRTIKSLLIEPDLDSVRGEAIDALPEAERQPWRDFWSRVTQLAERDGSVPS